MAIIHKFSALVLSGIDLRSKGFRFFSNFERNGTAYLDGNLRFYDYFIKRN